MKATIWDSDTLGATFQIKDIPADLVDKAKEYREKLIDLKGLNNMNGLKQDHFKQEARCLVIFLLNILVQYLRKVFLMCQMENYVLNIR